MNQTLESRISTRAETDLAARLETISAIISKEWAELIRNRMLLSSTFLLPLIFLIMPLAMIVGMQSGPVDAEEVKRYVELAPQFAGLAPNEVLQIILVNQFLIFFLLMPSIIPMTIASYSIIGEKQARTLEPLLASPASTGEILLGKVIAAVVPAVVVTWLTYGLFVAISFFITSPAVWLAAANATWLLAMVVIGSLLAVVSVFVAVIISSRVNDTRVAQQLGGLLVLPVAAFGVAQTAGFVFLSQLHFLGAAVVLAAAGAALYFVAVRLFQREQILTRWR